MICVSIQEPRFDRCLELVYQFPFTEIRLDKARFTREQVRKLFSTGNKTIATFRPGNVTDEVRLKMLIEAISGGAAIVDIELESDAGFISEIKKFANSQHCDLMISYHNLHETPDARFLDTVLTDCYNAGADIAKIATMVNCPDDLARLVSLYTRPGRKVVIGMGDMGRISRVAARYLGAEFTFVSKEPGSETAPGQLSMAELESIFKLIDHT
jgi:3-dehydroquinate dehydratase type I